MSGCISGNQISGKQRRSKYKSYRGEVGKIAPNILDRKFNTDAPYTKLTTDVTEFNVCNEKVYLSPVLDMYNNEIISYSISPSPNFAQTKEMLKGLFERLPENSRPILHSDQGWQYQMKEFQSQLKEHNILQSMSRKGNCLDNSVMENFFGRLKVEMFYGERVHSLLEQRENLSQTKRNEPGTVPNSFPNNLILFCPNFGVHFNFLTRLFYCPESCSARFVCNDFSLSR